MNTTRNLIANYAMRLVFALNELRDTREISETLGTSTVRSKRETVSKSQT